METKREIKEKYCGNCSYHNVYEFPSKIFCTYRLAKGLDPIISTLWCCENWQPSVDDCFCVEAAKKQAGKHEESI